MNARTEDHAPSANGVTPAAEYQMAARSVLRFVDISMRFPDGTHAVDHVDLSLEEGDLLGIVGPSGCGKSTLLRMAAGLQVPSGGRVEVGTNNVGVVFQDPTLLPWRSVEANVRLLAELKGVKGEGRDSAVRNAIDLVGLTGFEKHKPMSLSGGMRMRVSLARTLALDPSLFLFDEPFGALDELTRERLGEELLAIAQTQRMTGMLITHSVSEAVLLCNRLVVMSPRPGRIVSEHAISLPYPRTADLRFDREFNKLSESISHDLRRSMLRDAP